MSNTQLQDLHTALIDANEGYEKAIEKAEVPGVLSMFKEMHALHSRAHADLHRALSNAGEQPDDDGSFMSTVHRAAISVRSAVSGIDEDALPSFADGEDRIGEKYNEAIEDESDGSIKAMLQSHRSAHQTAVARMRELAKRYVVS